jgi:hypothetical protein
MNLYVHIFVHNEKYMSGCGGNVRRSSLSEYDKDVVKEILKERDGTRNGRM